MRESFEADRQTERLILRRWNEVYLEEFAEVCSSRDAMRFITGGRAIPRKQIEEISNRGLKMWEEHGFGPWAAIDKASGRWVGRIGLNLLHDWPGPHRWEIGFELAPRFWGRGLATEGAWEGVRFGLEDVRLDRIISVTSPDHGASRRVMEKCGLVFQDQTEFRGTQVVWYAIDRTEFERSAVKRLSLLRGEG